MDPVKFSDDFHKFVLQDQNVRYMPMHPPSKPFDINAPSKSEKSKKDLKKDKKQQKRD